MPPFRAKAKTRTPSESRPQANRRRCSPVAVDRVVQALSARSVRRFGFTQTTLIERWAEIVGDRLSAVSLPVRLSFPPSAQSGGTLTVRIEGPMATQMQHASDIVIARINSFFGYNAVERLYLVHGHIPPTTPRPRRIVYTPTEAHLKHMAHVPESPLKEALLRLAATFVVDKQL